MKSRNERRLIELAFGDLPAETEAHVAADPAAKERLAEYRQMKAALSQLREIPDHQLSTERMRQAILNRGVARRRRYVWERFGYAAAACAIFFVAFGLARHLRTSSSPVVSMPDGNVADQSGTLFSAFNPGFTFGAPITNSSHGGSSHSSNHKRLLDPEMSESRHITIGTLADFSHAKHDHVAPIRSKKVPQSAIDAASDSAPLVDNSPPDNGVLVIEDGSDSSTGLSNAKEVASKSAEVGG